MCARSDLKGKLLELNDVVSSNEPPGERERASSFARERGNCRAIIKSAHDDDDDFDDNGNYSRLREGRKRLFNDIYDRSFTLF